MIILEENFKWHLEAFASELFIWTLRSFVLFVNKQRRDLFFGCPISKQFLSVTYLVLPFQLKKDMKHERN